MLLAPGIKTISQLNILFIKKINSYLGIKTPLETSENFTLVNGKTQCLLDILSQKGASTYVSGPSASAYIDTKAFQAAGIRLEYKSYDYKPYPQMWGQFNGAVTVLDLIANCGPESRKYLRSISPNIRASMK